MALPKEITSRDLERGKYREVSATPGSVAIAVTNPDGTPIAGGTATNVNLNQVGGASVALGKTTGSGSIPVISASDQSPAAGQVTTTLLRTLDTDQFTALTSTTAVTTIVTADATHYTDLVSLTLNNTSATDTEVTLYNDDGTTVRWSGTAKANDMRGIVFSLPFTQTAVNKAWKLACTTSVASVKVTAQFVKNS